jgi:hypothetical protein
MGNAENQKNNDHLEPERALILRYKGEDDQSFLVASQNGARLRVPKNRKVQKTLLDQPSRQLKPAFRLLALAFLGLAPAGLGTLVLAPLAALWALVIWVTHPLPRADTLRVILVWGLAAGLLAIAIPLSKLFLARLS